MKKWKQPWKRRWTHYETHGKTRETMDEHTHSHMGIPSEDGSTR